MALIYQNQLDSFVAEIEFDFVQGISNYLVFNEKISATSIGNPSPGEDEAAMDSARECEGKGACELKSNKRFADKIMPQILNMYRSCEKANDFDMYAPNASFEDPLTHAQGVFPSDICLWIKGKAGHVVCFQAIPANNETLFTESLLNLQVLLPEFQGFFPEFVFCFKYVYGRPS